MGPVNSFKIFILLLVLIEQLFLLFTKRMYNEYQVPAYDYEFF